MNITFETWYTGQPGIANTQLGAACPANTTLRVISCTVTNDTTTAGTITFHKVPSGGAAGDTNLIMNAKPLGSKETYNCPEVVGKVLTAGAFFSAIASIASQFTVDLDVSVIVG